MEKNNFDFLNKYNLNKYAINNISIGINNENEYYLYNFTDKNIYDIASLTKLFTLNLLYNLNINMNDPISKYLNTKLEVSVLDLIKMKHYFRLDKNLTECKDYNEIKVTLLKAQIQEEKYNYNDISFCILGILIEEVSQKTLKENFEVLFKLYKLHNTKILPQHYNVLGNGNFSNYPHDKKTKIMNGISGAAGIFSNCEDILKYCNLIINYQIFDKDFIDNIFKFNWIDTKNRNRTYAGLYKFSTNKSSYVKNNTYSLAHQGYTGSWLLMDFKNKKCAVLLMDSINSNSLEKHPDFFGIYHPIITNITNALS